MAVVLVVDDEAVVRKPLRDVIEAAGYQVVEAANGRVDPRVLGRIDAAVVDIFMPDRDGLELISDLRRGYPHVKIVAITGLFRYGEVDALEVARRMGAHATLEKPFDMKQLLAALESLLTLGAGS